MNGYANAWATSCPPYLAGAGFLVDKSFDSAYKYLPVNKYTQPAKAVMQVLKPVLSSAAGQIVDNVVKDKASR